MRLKGRHELAAPVEQVWKMLTTPDVLARVTPGIDKLEPVGEDVYKASFLIKLGPVKGSFQGDLALSDKIEHERFKFSTKVNGKQGYVSAQGELEMEALDEKSTLVTFAGEAQISGLLARTAQRVMSGVANMLAKQFFKALEKEILSEK